MIHIKIELWPHGNESRKRVLATADIANDGSGSPWLGSYGFILRGANGRTMKEGHIGEFKRRRFHVWALVAACLRVAFPSVERAFRGREILARIK